MNLVNDLMKNVCVPYMGSLFRKQREIKYGWIGATVMPVLDVHVYFRKQRCCTVNFRKCFYHHIPAQCYIFSLQGARTSICCTKRRIRILYVPNSEKDRMMLKFWWEKQYWNEYWARPQRFQIIVFVNLKQCHAVVEGNICWIFVQQWVPTECLH